MTVMKLKVISTFLMLLCFFLCSSGLTEQEFNAFKGEDPTRYCSNTEKLKTWCNSIGGKTGTIPSGEPFLDGCPYCAQGNIKLSKEGGGDVTKPLTIVVCGWKNHYYYSLGKGQAEGHVMNYECHSSTKMCSSVQDVPYS